MFASNWIDPKETQEFVDRLLSIGTALENKGWWITPVMGDHRPMLRTVGAMLLSARRRIDVLRVELMRTREQVEAEQKGWRDATAKLSEARFETARMHRAFLEAQEQLETLRASLPKPGASAPAERVYYED